MSDRILVMSDRPGRIVEEIDVGLPNRESPMERMGTKRAGEIVAHLFDALHINERVNA
jgi:NitT/TauT family transport system ATP-binding protein